MADNGIPLRRTLVANAVALAPSWGALAILFGLGELSGRTALIAMAGIAVVTIFLVQRYLGSLASFARFVGELSDEREPVMPRLSFAPATEELASAAATLAVGWRRQRASIDNLAASAQTIVDGLPDPLVRLDRQRRIVRTNLAAALLLGWSGRCRARCLDGTAPTAAPCRHRRPAGDRTRRQFRAPTSSAVELVLAGPPELDVVAHLRRLPRAAADGSLALIVLHDTTALRRAERMRGGLRGQRQPRTQDADRGPGRLHRNPARPGTEDTAARERFLGIMAEQADRMRRLVDDLLMLSRIEQHEHARPAAAVDLGACCAPCSTSRSSRPHRVI